MIDLINRQEAIDALDKACDIVCQYSKLQRSVMCGSCPLGSAFDAIEELPSAQPKSNWIPCSERLPRTEDFMIITMLDDSGDIPIIYSDFGWYASVGGFWVVDNETRKDVVAWMPLPKPYGGVMPNE